MYPERQRRVTRAIEGSVAQIKALVRRGVGHLDAAAAAVNYVSRTQVASAPRPVLPSRAERVAVDCLVGLSALCAR